jgi:hypothetical protein
MKINQINEINEIIQSAIKARSIFDEFLNDHIIYYETESDKHLSYNGKDVDFPFFYSSIYFDMTKNFTKKEFDALKNEFNRIALLDILANIAQLEEKMLQFNITPDNNYKKLFSLFDGTTKIKDSKYVIDFIKECNANVNFLVANLEVYDIEGHHIFFKSRLGSLMEMGGKNFSMNT